MKENNNLSKFEEWCKNEPYFYNAGKSDMLMGWNACKNEVLKILRQNTKIYEREVDDLYNGIIQTKETHISPAIKEEIENL